MSDSARLYRGSLSPDEAVARLGGQVTEIGDLETVIGGLYTHYLPGVEIPSDEELIAMVE